jgi:hypothetical protein
MGFDLPLCTCACFHGGLSVSFPRFVVLLMPFFEVSLSALLCAAPVRRPRGSNVGGQRTSGGGSTNARAGHRPQDETRIKRAVAMRRPALIDTSIRSARQTGCHDPQSRSRDRDPHLARAGRIRVERRKASTCADFLPSSSRTHVANYVCLAGSCGASRHYESANGHAILKKYFPGPIFAFDC